MTFLYSVLAGALILGALAAYTAGRAIGFTEGIKYERATRREDRTR
jgi:hypothetical protein